LRFVLLKYLVIPFLFISYFFIDSPLVLFLNKNGINKNFVLEIFTHIPDVIIGILVIYFVLFIFLYRKWQKYKCFNIFFLAMISVAISVQVKDLLKYVFGRYWPDTWINGNPSLIVHNAYGFHFFQKGSEYSSFPSGHTTVTFAFFCVFVYFYPKFKNYFYIPMFLLGLGQVLKHYHFLSDVVAGGFLGWVVAITICKYYMINIDKKLIK